MTHDPSATSGVVTSLATVLHAELKPLAAEVNELLAGRTQSTMPATLTKLQQVCLFSGLWGVGIYLGALRELTEQVLALNGRDSNRADLAERHRVLAFGLNTLAAYLKDLAAGTTVSYLHLNQAFGKLVRRARPELLEMDAKQVDQLLFMAAPPTLEIAGSFSIAGDSSRSKLLGTIAAALVSRDGDDLRALATTNPYLSLSGYMEAIGALVDEQGSIDGTVYREQLERVLDDLARIQADLAAGEPLHPPVCDPHLFSSLMATIAALDEPGRVAGSIRTKYGLVDSAQAGAINDRARAFVEGLDKAIDGLSQSAKRNVLRAAQADAQELARHAEQLPSPAFKGFAYRLRDLTEAWKATPPAEADWVHAMGLLHLMRACALTWGNDSAQRYLAGLAAEMGAAGAAGLPQCEVLQEASANAALVKLFKLMTQESDLLSAEMDGALKLMQASASPSADAATVAASAGPRLARRADKLAGLFMWVSLPVAAETARALGRMVQDAVAWVDPGSRATMVASLSELRVLLTRLRPTSMLDLEVIETSQPSEAPVSHGAGHSGELAVEALLQLESDAPFGDVVAEGLAAEDHPKGNIAVVALAAPVPAPAGGGLHAGEATPASVFGEGWAQGAPDWPTAADGDLASDQLELSEPGDPLPVAAADEHADLLPPEVVDAFRLAQPHEEGASSDAGEAHPELEAGLTGQEAELQDDHLGDADPVAELRRNLARVDAEFADKLHGSEAVLTVLFEEVDTCVNAIASCITEIRRGEAEERVSEIRRRIHTLKGASRTCKLDASGFILHELESFLDQVPDDNEALAPFLDTVEAVLADARRRLDDSKALFLGGGAPASVPHPVHAVVPPPAVVERAARAATQLLAQEPQATPSLAARQPAHSEAASTVRIPVTLATTVGQTSGSLLAASQESIARMENLQKLMQAVSQMVLRIGPISRELQSFAGSAGVGASAAASGLDALELERSTTLQDMAQQLAEAAEDMGSHADALAEALRNAANGQRQLAGIAVDLQRQSSELLLVPVDTQRGLLASTVELACQDTGKQVELVIDRAARMPAGIVDRLSNVIGHILRNAVAHGIEAPEVRVAAGKAPKGTITLGAPRSGGIKGGFVQLAIRDDGAGIDLARVLAKAVERGLVDRGADLSTVPAGQVRDLIFAKGFSTAEQVSQLAGRGVGLDVVRSYLKSIGGEVAAVEPDYGGTEFVLTLPVDAASMAVIPVVAGGYRCMVPSSLVARIVPASTVGVTIDWEQARVVAAGHTFPLRDLRRHVPGGGAGVVRGGFVLFMRDGQALQAVFVDAVGRQQRVITKSLGPVVRDIPGFVAATHADTTGLTLVLNPVDLPAPRGVGGQAADAVADGAAQRTVMVVDDSTTVQKASRLFLEGLGFSVVSASNGKQALDALAESEHLPDVILSDIEMPGMDGFDLLSALKRSERTRGVPVAIISSRSNERQQARAMDLGAVKYMLKPFNEFEVAGFLEALFGRAALRATAVSG